MQCDVREAAVWIRVEVAMPVPHPAEMLIYQPSGTTVWLRHPDLTYQFPETSNFEELASFVIDESSQGTRFRPSDGKPELIPVLAGQGEYHLYLAENTETEPENTLFFDCRFTVDGVGDCPEDDRSIVDAQIHLDRPDTNGHEFRVTMPAYVSEAPIRGVYLNHPTLVFVDGGKQNPPKLPMDLVDGEYIAEFEVPEAARTAEAEIWVIYYDPKKYCSIYTTLDLYSTGGA